MPQHPKTKTIKKIGDLTPDPSNANQGTERGASLLEQSLRNYGAGRSVLVDKNGVIIAGNKTIETAMQTGMEEIVVVPTDGRKIIVHQRLDLDLEKDRKARELAIADNRVGELNLDWNPVAINAAIEAGVEIIGFSEKELAKFAVEEVSEQRIVICPRCRARFYEDGQILEVGNLQQ